MCYPPCAARFFRVPCTVYGSLLCTLCSVLCTLLKSYHAFTHMASLETAVTTVYGLKLAAGRGIRLSSLHSLKDVGA